MYTYEVHFPKACGVRACFVVQDEVNLEVASPADHLGR